MSDVKTLDRNDTFRAVGTALFMAGVTHGMPEETGRVFPRGDLENAKRLRRLRSQGRSHFFVSEEKTLESKRGEMIIEEHPSPRGPNGEPPGQYVAVSLYEAGTQVDLDPDGLTISAGAFEAMQREMDREVREAYVNFTSEERAAYYRELEEAWQSDSKK